MANGKPTESAVVVVVPEAERLVGVHRERLDWAAAWGVPAHVTVLYPWVPPAEIDEVALGRLGGAVAGTGTFAASFPRARWFNDDVLWLAPEPEARFRGLVEAVAAAFPEHPPYAGRFAVADVVPHLTVADQGTLAERRAAELDVRRGLPVTTTVTDLRVLAGSAEPGSWHEVARVPLA
ncbi:MAG: 2'-5' RNA ligase family protein [Nocardioidaceae bacterium]